MASNFHTGTSGLILGVVLTVLGAVSMAVGNALMKLGILKESDHTGGEVVTAWPLSQPSWWGGMIMYAVGAIAHFLGLLFAPASILAPVNNVGLIASAVAASTMLKEDFSWREVLGTAGTVVGVTFCAAASLAPKTENLEVDGMNSWSDKIYLSYLGVVGVVILLALVILHAEENRVVEDSWNETFQKYLQKDAIMPQDGKYQDLKMFKNDDESSSYEEKFIGPEKIHFPSHIGLLYGLISGVVGSQVVLEIKEAATCIEIGFSGSGSWIWYSPQIYVASFLFLASAVLQIHFLNFGLGRGETALVVPTYYISWTFFGTLGGFSKFHEAHGFGISQFVLFGIGISVTLFFVGFMAMKDLWPHPVSEFTDVLQRHQYQNDVSWDEQKKIMAFNVPLALGFGLMASRTSFSTTREPGRVRRVRSHGDLAGATRPSTRMPRGGWTVVSPEEIFSDWMDGPQLECGLDNRRHSQELAYTSYC
eukprot:GHVP01035271.1.p1 GENE.GHVP01035271.1~~GHVP01035271.1.p1  ORF type:complete len:478 (+),score=71.43 GHVP01035271.1:1307-2740(+)